MMTGVVKSSREAIVRLKLRGTNGVDSEVEAVLDTGFTESLTLPQAWIVALALPRVNLDRVTLADGTIVGVDLHEGTVVWNGQDRAIIVHCMEGVPLIGMSLIYDHLLTLEATDGGSVTIAALP
jgi:clan AA aspartic protease